MAQPEDSTNLNLIKGENDSDGRSTFETTTRDFKLHLNLWRSTVNSIIQGSGLWQNPFAIAIYK